MHMLYVETLSNALKVIYAIGLSTLFIIIYGPSYKMWCPVRIHTGSLIIYYIREYFLFNIIYANDKFV